ncbi:hypothetical protein HI914_07068 [Erysiphe necator]|nr:hypothetical protein HI914_07068 [Erysiphe necator]
MAETPIVSKHQSSRQKTVLCHPGLFTELPLGNSLGGVRNACSKANEGSVQPASLLPKMDLVGLSRISPRRVEQGWCEL